MGKTIYEVLESFEPSACVGVDAITYTTTTSIGKMALNAALVALMPRVEDCKRVPFRTNGASGFAQGSVRYAEKQSATGKKLWCILMVTGSMSQDILRYGYLDVSATRLDLRVDVKLREPVRDFAHKCYRVMGGENSAARFISSFTGETLYPVESRELTYYGRLYDKSLEYGEDLGSVWRYEIEIKRRAAPGIQAILLECHDIEEFISQTVFGVFSENWQLPVPGKGIKPRLNYTGLTATSVDQKLDWIKRNVGPTVRKLMTLGLEDDVVAALGVAALGEKAVTQGSLWAKSEGMEI